MNEYRLNDFIVAGSITAVITGAIFLYGSIEVTLETVISGSLIGMGSCLFGCVIGEKTVRRVGGEQN